MEANAPANNPAPIREVQPTQHRRADSGETERPASAQLIHGTDTNEEVEEEEEEEDDEEEEEEDWNAADPVAEFDWEGLHRRYHEVINNASEEEAALMEEWNQLMNFFKIWAEAGHSHETDRTFKRLQTRTSYTQNAETELEKSRMHYTQVVNAFQSALNLLQSTGLRI
ncbi:hypothetical protein P280DRAFT_472848 [Massarina eburnea CBS 473.64]|uniref:Uncharacterized protein n=1 Tax=Massarina eburnea CBS 473.64 TaxID=1395130 RepID=A0A6A6RMP3_9PLEO|nr:hypothetical protein P280DRAFT_472848 [Massarina eburnea CBS 473.64]